MKKHKKLKKNGTSSRVGDKPIKVLQPHELAGLTEKQYLFANAYLSNGFNASEAYRRGHPECTNGTSRVEGCRLLAHPSIRAFIGPLLEAAWKPYQMGGEEALARIGRTARADMRELYDAHGRLLPVHQWPDSIAGCVRAFDGAKVTFESQTAAQRIILEQTGKLKTVADSVDALAEAIRQDRERHGVKDA